MNNWEKLCDLLGPLLGTDVKEKIFENYFVKALKDVFGWGGPSMEQQKEVPVGSTGQLKPDIILNGNNFGIAIEMKSPSDLLEKVKISQIMSYMRIHKYRYGLLVGGMIKVFYDDDVSGSDLKEVVSIDFDSNNPEGIALGEILDKNVCSDEKLKQYVAERLAEKEREGEKIVKQEELKRLREKLRSELLENNGEMIKSMLKERLISDEYTEEMLDDILDGIEIRPKGIQGIGGGGTPPPFNTITEFKERCIIIKIKEENIWNKNGSSDEKLYETVRRCWRNKISSVERAEYVLAVVKGTVRGVYRPMRWYEVKQPECMICPVGENDRPCGRIAFEGEKAGEDIQNKYLHKDIPVEFKKLGMASPVLFTF